MNSMQSKLTPDSTANRVKMSRSQYKGAFLIVEGMADSQFFSNFTIQKDCRILIAANKLNVINAIRQLNSDRFEGVIGIIDADFDRLEQVVFEPNLFLTDTHDLESMCLKSPVLEKILINKFLKSDDFTQKKQISESSITKSLEIAREIGYIRYYSDKNSLSMSFKNLILSDYIDSKLNLNLVGLIQKSIENVTTKKLSPKQVLEDINKLKDNAHDSWQLCHGKDLVDILWVVIPIIIQQMKCKLRQSIIDLKKSETDSAKLKDKLRLELSTDLRLAYEFRFFTQTELFKSIFAWEGDNPLFKIFSPQ